MTRSVKVSSWSGPAPAARSRSRPRRSCSLDSCCAVHGSASSAISLASRRLGIPVQIRWDKAVRAHPDVTIKIVPHGHLHDRSGSVSYRAQGRYHSGDGWDALGDPTRRAIVACLAERPRAVGELADELPISIAEWYVLDMLEKSRAGFEEHTRQGFNIGAAPYGYLAERVPHPVVAQIFAWRVEQRLSYAAIAGWLDTDPSRYPPPTPTTPARALGHWSTGTVRGVLLNPKYTGFMVWNRRATKSGGKLNAIAEWVCSPKPTHAPVISVETYTAAAKIGRWRQGSRCEPSPNPHPATRPPAEPTYCEATCSAPSAADACTARRRVAPVHCCTGAPLRVKSTAGEVPLVWSFSVGLFPNGA